MKKSLYLLVVATSIFLPSACSHRGGSESYDSELCRELSLKIERRDSLSQDDYACIINQNEQILKYLTDRASDVAGLPDSCRAQAWRQLVAEPEYLERFGYMFTLGSALYQADLNGRLDSENKRSYADLDRYNEMLADYTDRY